MDQVKIKILTLFALAMFPFGPFAANFTSEQARTHLRWNFFVPENSLKINQVDNRVVLKTLDHDIARKLYTEMKKNSSDEQYIKKVTRSSQGRSEPNKIIVELKSDAVESFSFYVSRDRKYVLDFWSKGNNFSDQDKSLEHKIVNSGDHSSSLSSKTKRLDQKNRIKKDEKLSSNHEVQEVVTTQNAPRKDVRSVKNEAHRDFRYGASFIWDYEAKRPRLPEHIDLNRKTPEYFYPITDRDFEKNEKEAHLQLTINLFRKRNFGLMYKSIRLFEEKYGVGDSFEVIEYLKANALLRDNLNQGNRDPVKTAISMLSNLAERTDNYDLKKGIYKYLIASFIRDEDFVKSLDYSKRLYVNSRENYDYEEAEVVAETILYSLSRLNQINDIRELTEDENIQSLISSQKIKSFKYYALIKTDDYEEVIRDYEKNQDSFSRPINPSLLFNVAESYFRDAQYQKAIDLFDLFLSNYSHLNRSSDARLRIALSYDILDRDLSQVAELYKNAINRSTNRDIMAEARIRYVALTNLRRKNFSDRDKEFRVLLNFNNERDQGTSSLNDNNQKLLWLVRLRTLIVDEKYQEALSYLNAIPINRLNPTERRVFIGDGAEVVYGMIFDEFKVSNYGKVVKIWELYKDEYVDKVAKDPFVNYIVGSSFIRLRLYQRFDHVVSNFEKYIEHPAHSFPLWLEREEVNTPEAMLLELKVKSYLELENYDLAGKTLRKFYELDKSDRYYYYLGILSYRQNQFVQSAKALENFLSRQTTESVYDPRDVAELLLAYSDSVYQTQSPNRYLQVSSAILKDTDSFAKDHEFLNQVRERILYLYIETLAQQDFKSLDEIEDAVNLFLSDYPSSQHIGRVKLLLGMIFVENQQERRGVSIFEEILANESVEGHIKEMVRSEMALINIRSKNL